MLPMHVPVYMHLREAVRPAGFPEKVRAFPVMVPSQCFLISPHALVLHTVFTAGCMLLTVRRGLSLFKDSSNFQRLNFIFPGPLVTET